MDEVFLSQPYLTNQLIGNLDIEYFTDGSSFVWDSTQFSGYAVATLDSVIEAHPLGLLHRRLNLLPSHKYSSSLQESK
jgi:hypothetical protein